ncbi:ubiquitin hydrolase [Trema orientale]|uniref:Ubiquitin hydrolase n=1 Tax=Trema orientale TaxID=63057 RepID=A0A2P5FYY8_TREOI|nr:ubiquitin hydrolase [Trema orientale]
MDATQDYFRKSGQIPAFGDWDYANELPITQYFECARQAGLIRYSSSSGDSDQHARPDLYTLDHCPQKPSRTTQTQTQPRKTRGREKRCPHVKEQKIKQQSKVCDVTEPPRKPSSHQTHHHHQPNDAVPPRRPARLPKPVDEDLYKIPPELLHASKRKKRLGIFSRCLVPACTS